jgi:hypothetical protein
LQSHDNYSASFPVTITYLLQRGTAPRSSGWHANRKSTLIQLQLRPSIVDDRTAEKAVRSVSDDALHSVEEGRGKLVDNDHKEPTGNGNDRRKYFDSILPKLRNDSETLLKAGVCGSNYGGTTAWNDPLSNIERCKDPKDGTELLISKDTLGKLYSRVKDKDSGFEANGNKSIDDVVVLMRPYACAKHSSDANNKSKTPPSKLKYESLRDAAKRSRSKKRGSDVATNAHRDPKISIESTLKSSELLIVSSQSDGSDHAGSVSPTPHMKKRGVVSCHSDGSDSTSPPQQLRRELSASEEVTYINQRTPKTSVYMDNSSKDTDKFSSMGSRGSGEVSLKTVSMDSCVGSDDGRMSGEEIRRSSIERLSEEEEEDRTDIDLCTSGDMQLELLGYGKNTSSANSAQVSSTQEEEKYWGKYKVVNVTKPVLPHSESMDDGYGSRPISHRSTRSVKIIVFIRLL